MKTSCPARTCLKTPFRGLAFLAAIIDQHQPAARLQGGMQRGQRFLGKLEVVIDVAEEDHVDRGRRQFARIDFGEHRLDILDSGVFAGRLDMFEEVRGDVGGIDGPARRDFRGEQPREQPGAGADVGHRHARLEPAGGDDLLAEVEHLAALDLERGDELLRVGVFFVRRVDARIDALLLGPDGGGEKQGKQQEEQTLINGKSRKRVGISEFSRQTYAVWQDRADQLAFAAGERFRCRHDKLRHGFRQAHGF